MDIVKRLGAKIETLRAAQSLAEASAALTLCDESGDAGAVMVHTCALYASVTIQTEEACDAIRSLCLALCEDLHGMALDIGANDGCKDAEDAKDAVVDFHCGGVQASETNRDGTAVWRIPIWVEVQGNTPAQL